MLFCYLLARLVYASLVCMTDVRFFFIIIVQSFPKDFRWLPFRHMTTPIDNIDVLDTSAKSSFIDSNWQAAPTISSHAFRKGWYISGSRHKKKPLYAHLENFEFIDEIFRLCGQY